MRSRLRNACRLFAAPAAAVGLVLGVTSLPSGAVHAPPPPGVPETTVPPITVPPVTVPSLPQVPWVKVMPISATASCTLTGESPQRSGATVTFSATVRCTETAAAIVLSVQRSGVGLRSDKAGGGALAYGAHAATTLPCIGGRYTGEAAATVTGTSGTGTISLGADIAC